MILQLIVKKGAGYVTKYSVCPISWKSQEERKRISFSTTEAEYIYMCPTGTDDQVAHLLTKSLDSFMSYYN